MTRKARRLQEFPRGRGILLRMYTRLGLQERPPRFEAYFFAYANLTSTIRRRDDTITVRFSDGLRYAPLPVIEATAAILLARLYRRRAPREYLETYRRFALGAATRRRMSRLRKNRARPVPDAPRGSHFDLERIFDDLNRRYFSGTLRRPRIGWSPRPWRRQLGCFDPALGQIVLTSWLDGPEVPRCVVEYVLYHEMLHLKHPVRRAGCTLRSHSAEFRAEERRFEEFERARRYLQHREDRG